MMRPLVGVVCDRFFLGEHDLHSAKHSYVRALMTGANVSPVLIPATRDIETFDSYLDALSGLLFPGGASNVEAHRYGGQGSADMLVDPDRDHVALTLMREAAARDMPMLAICRGFQELNVAFGGKLHTDIHACGHSADHLEDLAEDLSTRYRYRHEIDISPAGILSTLANAPRVRVNSLHRQGVAALAPRLVVEARAGWFDRSLSRRRAYVRARRAVASGSDAGTRCVVACAVRGIRRELPRLSLLDTTSRSSRGVEPWQQTVST